jgi:hypothetical protein
MSATAVTHNLFTPLEQQLEDMLRWNVDVLGSYYKPDQFKPIAERLPDLFHGQVEPWALTMYQANPVQTLEAHIKVLQNVWSKFWKSDYLIPSVDKFRQLPGVQDPVNCLRWEKISVNANRNARPDTACVDMLAQNILPASAGVFAIAANHTELIKAQGTEVDGTSMCYMNVPGYQARHPNRSYWSGLPCVDLFGGELRLCVHWAGSSRSRWSVPGLVEVV